jgi:hypothetical protein
MLWIHPTLPIGKTILILIVSQRKERLSEREEESHFRSVRKLDPNKTTAKTHRLLTISLLYDMHGLVSNCAPGF